ncbi:expressed protein [Phakopsora pachyrhizi]|uniref:chitin deacetylase n=1 Tax=Phakopsora pachyrhizi TaxID=170000 RepID=A0AAV0AII0_PHAPC|nr:expressed protein [Phakopsora pachyrhizi]
MMKKNHSSSLILSRINKVTPTSLMFLIIFISLTIVNSFVVNKVDNKEFYSEYPKSSFEVNDNSYRPSDPNKILDINHSKRSRLFIRHQTSINNNSINKNPFSPSSPIVYKNYPQSDQVGPKPLATWLEAYREAKASGLIPNFAPSVLKSSTNNDADGSPTYPYIPESRISDKKDICSWTISKCESSSDIVNSPKGVMGISFDDGPRIENDKLTKALNRFLRSNQQASTHFLIGSRILDSDRDLLRKVFDQPLKFDHLAVHTWSHPYMTTLSDEKVLGEIGWTIQIIYDYFNLLPAFWRPPYGDVDNRVRAICEHVFGLKTIMWSSDTNDWCLSDESNPNSDCAPNSGPQDLNQLVNQLKKIINQSSPQKQQQNNHSDSTSNYGVLSLEHELSVRTVQGFIQTFPLAKKLGYNTKSIPDLLGLPWYHSALDSNLSYGVLPSFKKENSTASQPQVSSTVISPSTPSSIDSTPSPNLDQSQNNSNCKIFNTKDFSSNKSCNNDSKHISPARRPSNEALGLIDSLNFFKIALCISISCILL